MFDLNTDGVANYGMFADWLQELQVLAGRPILDDMFHGAEAYLEMWERAYGVPATACLPSSGVGGSTGLGSLRLGATFTSLLYAAGQPTARPARTYRYCVAAGPGAVAAVFGRSGRVALVASSAPGYTAGGLRPGQARRGRDGLLLGRVRRGGWRAVAVLRAGRIRVIGVSTARSRAAVLSDMLAAGLS